MNFLFLSVFICGALSHSLQPAKDASLVEMYKQNPTRFISSMADVDPSQISSIIGMLEELKEKSEIEEARLISELADANKELGEASNDVLDAQGALSAAELVRDNAIADHGAKEKAREDREAEEANAQSVVNNQEASLEDEQTVLDQVIALLRGLLPEDFVQRKSRNLLGLASALSDPTFIAQMAKADPAKVQEIIDLLQSELDASKLREKEMRDALQAAKDAVNEAGNAVIAAKEAWTAAQATVDDIDRDLASKVQTEVDAQAKKDAAQSVHDAEVEGLDDEQKVLGDVIQALKDLLSRQ